VAEERSGSETEYAVKVIVCQQGARRRYAVASMLENAGMLAALYTDSSIHSTLGKVAQTLKPVAGGRLRRLLQRVPEGIPREKVRSCDAIFLSDLWANVRRCREDHIGTRVRRDGALSRHMLEWGVDGAEVVVSQDWESYDFLAHAKGHGKKVVIDVNVSPLTYRILAEESARYPQWGPRFDASMAARAESDFQRVAGLADLLLCPSAWVAEGVRTLMPQSTDRIRICPYGCSIDFGGRTNVPMPGRILFAGGNAVRKGLPDFAQAAQILKERHSQLDFRVAGGPSLEVRALPECSALNFLGKLLHSQMQEEFLAADMFVLPTRSEGLAAVAVEAINAGCPVITTRCAGLDITDGVDGLLVSPGDVDGLVQAIDRLYGDRNLRSRLAEKTQELGPHYSMDAWKERFVNLIRAL